MCQKCWSKAQRKQSSFNQFLRKKRTAEEIYQFLSPHLQAELEPEPDQVLVPDPEPGPYPDQEPRPDPDPEPGPDPDQEPGPHPYPEPGPHPYPEPLLSPKQGQDLDPEGQLRPALDLHQEKSTLCMLCCLLFQTHEKMDIHMKRHSIRKKTPLR